MLKEWFTEKNNSECTLEIEEGILYNLKAVEIKFIDKTSDIRNIIDDKLLSDLNVYKKEIFYRGHSDANYQLIPSIMRTEKFKINEGTLYNEILIQCPSEFLSCTTHLEKLVKMQHYGLPTRLFDITRNFLFVLYFACKDNHDFHKEIVVLCVDKEKIKYPQSDSVSLLASLPIFSRYHENFFAKNESEEYIEKLLHEVWLEKPSFSAKIKQKDLQKNFVVCAMKNNNRIISQDRAFIICGLNCDNGFLEEFCYKKDNKKLICIVKNTSKKEIPKELDNFSINHSTLFPEIECVTEFLKEKYK